MKIAEIYRSIQGEGFLTGTPSAFIRTSGCNLRCWFCDTPYASWNPEGEDWSIEQILAEVAELDCEHVVLTGGEPMLCRPLVQLSRELVALGHHVTIETAGTRWLPVACQLMSISPKLSGSLPPASHGRLWQRRHQQRRHRPDVVRRLMDQYDYQLKFVIDAPEDCEEVERYLEELGLVDRSRVLLMPQGTEREALAERAEWLAEYCRERDLAYCPRRHIELYGLVRGT